MPHNDLQTEQWLWLCLKILSVEQSEFLLFANNCKLYLHILSDFFQEITPDATDVAIIHNLESWVSLIYKPSAVIFTKRSAFLEKKGSARKRLTYLMASVAGFLTVLH